MRMGFYDRRTGRFNGIADSSVADLAEGEDFRIFGGDVIFALGDEIKKPAGMKASVVLSYEPELDRDGVQQLDNQGNPKVRTIETWTLAIDSELMADVDDQILRDLRSVREVRLDESDWTQLPDVLANGRLSSEQVAAWATYRQALADLTNTIDLTNLASYKDIVWPSQPE